MTVKINGEYGLYIEKPALELASMIILMIRRLIELLQEKCQYLDCKEREKVEEFEKQ